MAPRPAEQGNVFSFGTASTSMPVATNAFGFGSASSGFAPASADSSSGSGAAMGIMQVKKKVKLNQ